MDAKAYKAVFLDFYGTLVHEDDEIIAEITKKMSAACGRKHSSNVIASYWWQSFRHMFESSCGTSFRTQRALETASINDTILHFGCEDLPSGIDASLFTFWQKPALLPDTKAFLNQISVPFCIVSNIDRADIEIAMCHHGIAAPALVTSEDAKAYKPKPEIFRLALDALRVSPCEVLHIGDSVTSDIIGAANAGIDSFWLNRKGRPVPEYCKPTYTGESLLDVFKQVRFHTAYG